MFDGQMESPIIHTSNAEERQVKDQSEEGNKMRLDEQPTTTTSFCKCRQPNR